MNQLLIVTAHFPPTNAVDMHRVRVSLPHYESCGWTPTVLTFAPECTDHPRDELLTQTVPDAVDVHRLRCISGRWTRPFGLGALAFRGLPAMKQALRRYCRELQPQVVFFSTTSFPLMSLSGQVGASCDAASVLDFQDPWISPEGTIHKRTLKTRLNVAIHRWLEPAAVANASGLMAVSGEYLDVLTHRYPGVRRMPKAVIPFGFSTEDQQVALSRVAAQSESESGLPPELLHDLNSGVVGLYAGAYVSAMEPMVAGLFQSLRTVAKNQPAARPLKLWFIGSNYDSRSGRSPVLELAARYDVQPLIRELPARIPYFDALALQSRAAFNLLFGSMSKGYNPSKLFNLLQAGRPTLAFVQQGSLVEELVTATGGVTVVSLAASGKITESTQNRAQAFLAGTLTGDVVCPPICQSVQAAWSARQTTELQCELFQRALNFRQQQIGSRPVPKPGEVAVS